MSEEAKKDRIEVLLNAYGADRVRWPEGSTEVLDGTEASEFDAMARSHRALDRLLHEAALKSEAAPAPQALMARIISALPAEDRADRSAPAPTIGSVVIFPGRIARRKRPTPTVAAREQLAAAVLLAASLVLGIFVGSTDLGRTTAAQVGELAGWRSVARNQQTSALDEALPLFEDEEIL